MYARLQQFRADVSKNRCSRFHLWTVGHGSVLSWSHATCVLGGGCILAINNCDVCIQKLCCSYMTHVLVDYSSIVYTFLVVANVPTRLVSRGCSLLIFMQLSLLDSKSMISFHIMTKTIISFHWTTLFQWNFSNTIHEYIL